MRYFKNVVDGYIISLSTSQGIMEITKEEYEKILTVIENSPQPIYGYVYKLKEDLTWELSAQNYEGYNQE